MDGGGEVLLDNMRLFKNSHADASVKDTFTPSPEAPNPDDNPDIGNDPVTTPTDGTTSYVPFDPLNPAGTTALPTNPDGTPADPSTGEGGQTGNSAAPAAPSVWLWLAPCDGGGADCRRCGGGIADSQEKASRPD